MLAKDYAQALHGLVKDKTQKEQGVVWVNFVGLLKRDGHYSLLSNILKNFELLLKKTDLSTSVIFVSNEGTIKKYKKEIESYKENIGDEFEIKIDDSLVGGFKIRTKDVLIDGSYKKALKDLYTKFVSG